MVRDPSALLRMTKKGGGEQGARSGRRERRVIRVKGSASRGEGSSTSMSKGKSMRMSGPRDAAVCDQWIRNRNRDTNRNKTSR